jgi:hypothetical protein
MQILSASPTGQDTSCIELCDSAFLFTRTCIKTASSNGAYASSQQKTNEGLDAMATNDPRSAAAAAPVPTKVTPIGENTQEKAELIRLFDIQTCTFTGPLVGWKISIVLYFQT